MRWKPARDATGPHVAEAGGESRAGTEGFAYSRSSVRTLTIGSWSRLAIAIVAIGLSLYALSVALTGAVELGLELDDAGATVGDVVPDTFGWESGLRAGQAVERLRAGYEPGGWAIQTAEANRNKLVLLGPVDLFLRASALAALLAVALGVLALPLARLPARRAELLAAFGVTLATVPIAIAYERTLGLAVIGAAAIFPWIWCARWSGVGRGAALAGLAVGSALEAGWIALRLADPVSAVVLRNGLGAWVAISAALLAVVGGRVTVRRLMSAIASLQLVDVLVLAGAVVLAIMLAGLGVSPLLGIAAVALPLVLLVGTRRRVADGLDRVLLAELREREAIRATEEERARVSREIHDDPLQEIAGVIRGLEGADPDPAAATASLREVAARLRAVATDLHPPVLDDLGLAPAIEGSARQVTGLTVEVAVTNRAGYGRGQRPPAATELAAFRIVQEAIANAVQHSDASRIRVSGEVTPDAIDLMVADDGRGLDDGEVEAALRAGHMGIASMRRRAASTGGELLIERADGGGAVVAFRWRR